MAGPALEHNGKSASCEWQPRFGQHGPALWQVHANGHAAQGFLESTSESASMPHIGQVTPLERPGVSLQGLTARLCCLATPVLHAVLTVGWQHVWLLWIDTRPMWPDHFTWFIQQIFRYPRIYPKHMLWRSHAIHLNQLVFAMGRVHTIGPFELIGWLLFGITLRKTLLNQPPWTSTLPNWWWASAAVRRMETPRSSNGCVRASATLGLAGSMMTSVGMPAQETHLSMKACRMLSDVSRLNRGITICMLLA